MRHARACKKCECSHLEAVIERASYETHKKLASDLVLYNLFLTTTKNENELSLLTEISLN